MVCACSGGAVPKQRGHGLWSIRSGLCGRAAHECPDRGVFSGVAQRLRSPSSIRPPRGRVDGIHTIRGDIHAKQAFQPPPRPTRHHRRALIPRFGEKEVGQISKADVLAYRAELGKATAKGKQTKLSAARINKMLNPLRQVLNEAADRFDFRTPFDSVKQLKTKRTDVDPFTLAEVKQILDTVRPDFRHYFTVRFFTGLRTGEVDGLQWKYVDFDNRLILVRETIVGGEEEYTKTDGSQRDIQMSQLVFDALQAQFEATGKLSKFVFCNRLGTPLDHKNVTNRVWYPLLRHLNLKQRRPYQCRHTAATLWLASGEAPEWIARQLGHTTTEMLFRVYSRYVPNLTRRDGSAFERLITQTLGTQLLPVKTAPAEEAEQEAELLAENAAQGGDHE